MLLPCYDIAEKLQNNLFSYGDRIPDDIVEILNENNKYATWHEPPLVNSIAKVGILFKKLLRGELTTNVTSPLTYLLDEQWNTTLFNTTEVPTGPLVVN